MADNLLTTSELGVKTQMTMARDLLEASTSVPETVTSIPETVTDPGLEGWQKSWEEPPPNTLPMYQPNIQWLKNDPVFGLYTKEGSRKVLKPMMTFNPPPLFSRVEGTLPSMLYFFRTPTFFWRPVGVMQLKVPCPNTDCPAPSRYSLVRHGYGSVARTVFGMKFPYTLLTERLICFRQGEAPVLLEFLELKCSPATCPRSEEYVPCRHCGKAGSGQGSRHPPNRPHQLGLHV
ncbi:PREDICTED: uncharacterized protein LOC106808425 [Priapulus caudatus]|uniref:Uncharacterized protein LOC106808425 n=1 Tax=Priapulus caudatus TaxID=37621 RepID=A0ABM1E359_PRICU|nr:PREDICTED: uncharacterized protein LOC106808425 [Priapulus caudatus]